MEQQPPDESSTGTSQQGGPPAAIAALATAPNGALAPTAATQSAAQSTTINPRLAPQNLEAERSVLGGILLTNEAIYDVQEGVKAEDFYREPHRKIYLAMQDLVMRNEPIDVITLGDELRKKGELEEVGGITYLSSLDSAVPATANLSRYAKIVRDKALARRLVEAAHTIAREGYEQLGDVDDLLDSAEQKIFDVTEKKASAAFTPLSVSVKRVFSNLEQLYERQTDITGVPTGFVHLDKMTAGFQRGDLIIVAGRPSMGKTSVVMNMAGHIAIEAKLPVAVFSLEMSADSLTTRLFASESRVEGQRLRTGKLLDSDWPKLARAADRLFRAPMFIDDSAGLTAMDMRAKCRRLKAKHNELGLVVIDYLQLMKGRAGIDNREQEISEISRGLKALARELDVPVIALSQLNRSLERREDKRPQLSDLRESGAIEQDADVICFIYRDEVYNKESADKGIAEIIIGKQRNGPTGIVRVAFLKDYTRFENLADDQAYGQSE
jgi:replicative DNA helicase